MNSLPSKRFAEFQYYPFGMLMPERKYSASDVYRYGFNGKEMDNEVKGEGAQYDYGFRIYDPRLGRFLSVDPLFKTYPWYTPYQFAGNKPIIAVDLDGMEEMETNTIEMFVFKIDAGLEDAARSASANPKAIAMLQQQSWNKIIVDINNIAQQQFDPNNNIDPNFGNRVKEATLSYLRSDPSNLTAYNTYSYYNNSLAGGNTDLTGIDQSILDKSFEIANDYARSAFFGQASYNNDLNRINQAKDPNTKAVLIQERHDRTTNNYKFFWFVNMQIMELFGGFMGLGASNLGPLNNSPSNFSLNYAKQEILLEGSVQKNFNRFSKSVPLNSKESIGVEKLGDGGYLFTANSPGQVPGSRAVYQKWVNAQGETTNFLKTTYDPDGNIIHIKDKISNTTIFSNQ